MSQALIRHGGRLRLQAGAKGATLTSPDSFYILPEAKAILRARLYRCGKLDSAGDLKGHSFSCAVQALHFCHPEATLVAEGSAVRTFPRPVQPCR